MFHDIFSRYDMFHDMFVYQSGLRRAQGTQKWINNRYFSRYDMFHDMFVY
jgi:hypothetical protein